MTFLEPRGVTRGEPASPDRYHLSVTPADRDLWRELGQQIRVDSIRASSAAGSGHPTSSMSGADLMAVLLAGHLRYDFDAPDDVPVDLLFVLLVPGEAHQEHLSILADIARRLSDPSFCEQLRGAADDRALYELATRDWE